LWFKKRSDYLQQFDFIEISHYSTRPVIPGLMVERVNARGIGPDVAELLGLGGLLDELFQFVDFERLG
jgi:hypothetical protein